MSAGTFRMRREAAERAAAEAAAKKEAESACEIPAEKAQEPAQAEPVATVAKPKPKAASRPA